MAMRLALGLALLGAAAMASAQAPASRVQELIEVAGDNPPARLMAPWIERDGREQARNRVLNQMEAGTLALLSGRLKSAEALFSDAQQQIETIYANNPAAAAARGKFVPEASKDFKGDPYERAMVGYYLGLIDLVKGDLDNARAGFRFAMLQDTMSASETYQDDMGLMQYLVGWTYWCEGKPDSAAEEFARARKIRPDLAPPQSGDTLLLLAETGKAPRKVQDGKYGELLRFAPPVTVAERQVAFGLGAQQKPAHLAEDIFFQAATRGGAAVDVIRAGKASFRQGADTLAGVGTTVASVSLGASLLSEGKSSRQLAMLGAVAGIAGIVSDSVARNTETLADDRAWMSLPGKIYVATGSATDSVEAAFFANDGRLLYAQPVPVRGRVGSCRVAYTRAAGARPGLVSKLAWQPMPALPFDPNAITATQAAKPAAISEEGAGILDRVRAIRDNAGTPAQH